MELTESEVYKLQVLKTLSNFQALEFSLKLYISTVYKIIKNTLDGKVAFDYAYQDVENFPLERLLAIFKKLNSNGGLQKRINKLISGRNLVAHKALIYSHPEIRDLLGGELSEHHDNVSNMESDLNECIVELVDEMQKVINIMNNESA